MRKIPTLFLRDPEDMSRVTEEVHPDCLWVLEGWGVATRKYDGTCVMLDDSGKWWARREVKRDKTPPPNFMKLSHDGNTGKTMGYEPIEQSSFHKAFRQGLEYLETHKVGTYELVGPKVNGNPERFDEHRLLFHADAEKFPGRGPYEVSTIRDVVRLTISHLGWEGLVWHHPDGRMAKLKVRDFKKEN